MGQNGEIAPDQRSDGNPIDERFQPLESFGRLRPLERIDELLEELLSTLSAELTDHGTVKGAEGAGEHSTKQRGQITESHDEPWRLGQSVE